MSLLPRLLGKYRMVRIRSLDMVNQHLLGSLVGSRHHIAVIKLRLYVKLVAAEVAHMHRSRLTRP